MAPGPEEHPSDEARAPRCDSELSGILRKVLQVFNPADSAVPLDFTNLTTTAILSVEAVKVVRLVVAQLDYGQFNANRISLTGSGLTPGVLPQLCSITPSTGPYYSATNSGLVTLRGSSFGTRGLGCGRPSRRVAQMAKRPEGRARSPLRAGGHAPILRNSAVHSASRRAMECAPNPAWVWATRA
jgi:hypothetical protein